MKLDESLNLLAQVCAGYKGNLQEHQALQEALKAVNDKCSEKKDMKKVPKKKEVGK